MCMHRFANVKLREQVLDSALSSAYLSVGPQHNGGMTDVLVLLTGSRVIHDHAYYWPHYSPISKAVEYTPQDVAVFTLSKLTGGSHLLTLMS